MINICKKNDKAGCGIINLIEKSAIKVFCCYVRINI